MCLIKTIQENYQMEFTKDAIQSGSLSKDLFGGCRMKTSLDIENKAYASLVIITRRFSKMKKKNIFGNRGRKSTILWNVCQRQLLRNSSVLYNNSRWKALQI